MCQPRRHEWWEVERSEDGQTVPSREERIRQSRGPGNGGGGSSSSRRDARARARAAKHPREAAVLVNAHAHVDGRRSDEFGGTGRDGGRWPGLHRRGERVDAIGGHISAEIQSEDQYEGL